MINHPRRNKKTTNKTSPVVAPKAARKPAGARPKATHDHDYSELLIGARQSFEQSIRGQIRLFRTDAAGLWDLYLNAIPAAERQIHNCNCCRHFIERFGGLVAIAATGEQWPVMWRANGVPDFYKAAFVALHQRVDRARVTGVFLTNQPTWGTPISNGKGYTESWQHLSVTPPVHFVHRDGALNADQAAAAVRENRTTVMNAMVEYQPAVLDETLRVLESGQLTRSEKFLGPVRWLRKLHDWPKGRENQKIRDNILWREVALAPEGFCHIKSSVIGPLMDSVRDGLPFADIERKFSAMLHPLKYQRPTAPPSDGNVRAAEALFEKLGLARSLERRYARLDELPLADAVWIPHIIRQADYRPVAKGSIFGHLKTKREASVASIDLPTQTMTWDKFRRTVLLQSPEMIEFLVPASGPFMALTTAEHEDAPPILKWDREEERNPVSSYTYVRPTAPSSWNLRAHSYVQVNAIMSMPQTWGSAPKEYLGAGMLMLLDGCRDTTTGQGNALFPENLRGDIHGARSTIEAYSKSAALGGRDEASACGYGIGTSGLGLVLRTKIAGAWTSYRIDRWD